ncbi:MAG: 30S ribosomal protein S9 [Candidatus Omnitrophota bacterium]|jgi:small subunit ribosomal protein S9
MEQDLKATDKFTAIGRRKEAVARVKLTRGSGAISINAVPLEKYFIRETDRLIIRQPLGITSNSDKYDINATLRGGGLSGQAEALRLGIARALVQADDTLKDALRKNGFLTRDPRAKERKKFGQKGARKRFQWTKR